MAKYNPPTPASNRGRLFWLRPKNLWAARRSLLRKDLSNRWRYSNEAATGAPLVERSGSIHAMLGTDGGAPLKGFRFLVLGDTGEGDESQYALLPVIRALSPDFMIINGDVAYPSGNTGDFEEGFFRPYRLLGIPIWATAGNHEYYSENKGREFLEVFASSAWKARWLAAGLRWVPQPGYYWELDAPDSPLVVLGLDSGQTGHLDGSSESNPEDSAQHEWLERRLAAADKAGKAAMILFHIPSLVDAGVAKEPRLQRLHEVLARHSSVRFVVTAHIHNLQVYGAGTWRQFVAHGNAPANVASGETAYIVNGGGGAYLSRPPRPGGAFSTEWTFPDREEWNEHVSAARKTLSALGLAKTLLDRVVGWFEASNATDDDSGAYTSLLVVDVDPGHRSTSVTPCCLKSIADIAERRPAGTFDPSDPSFRLSAEELSGCLRPAKVMRVQV